MAPDIPNIDPDRQLDSGVAAWYSAMRSCVCFFIRIVSLFSARPAHPTLEVLIVGHLLSEGSWSPLHMAN
jgi:hypothetical protein